MRRGLCRNMFAPSKTLMKDDSQRLSKVRQRNCNVFNGKFIRLGNLSGKVDKRGFAFIYSNAP